VLRTMVHVMMMMHLGSLVLLMMLGQVRMVCLLRMVMLVVVVVPDWLLIVATVVRGVSRVLEVVLMMLVVVEMRVHWRRRGHHVVRISWVQGQVIASAMVVVWVVARLRILGMNLEFGSDNSHFIRVWKFSRPW
jgi:hypothetical protein